MLNPLCLRTQTTRNERPERKRKGETPQEAEQQKLKRRQNYAARDPKVLSNCKRNKHNWHVFNVRCMVDVKSPSQVGANWRVIAMK